MQRVSPEPIHRPGLAYSASTYRRPAATRCHKRSRLRWWPWRVTCVGNFIRVEAFSAQLANSVYDDLTHTHSILFAYSVKPPVGHLGEYLAIMDIRRRGLQNMYLIRAYAEKETI